MTLDVIGSKSRLEMLRHLSRRDEYISKLMEVVGLDGKTAKYHLDNFYMNFSPYSCIDLSV